MDTAFPQLAFNDWLSRNLRNVVAAFTPVRPEEAYLSGAVDHADLERRQRALRHGNPIPHC